MINGGDKCQTNAREGQVKGSLRQCLQQNKVPVKRERVGYKNKLMISKSHIHKGHLNKDDENLSLSKMGRSKN